MEYPLYILKQFWTYLFVEHFVKMVLRVMHIVINNRLFVCFIFEQFFFLYSFFFVASFIFISIFILFGCFSFERELPVCLAVSRKTLSSLITIVHWFVDCLVILSVVLNSFFFSFLFFFVCFDSHSSSN